MRQSAYLLGTATAFTILSESECIDGNNTMTDTCCDVLAAAGLKILRPETGEYFARDTSYFSVSAQLSPYCIVQPTSADQVSLAITTLKTATTCNWAIRGGGHMTWAGASDIHEGVTLDLGLMNHTEYVSEDRIAKIGAGCRWRDVYATLEPYGVTAPGGRTATVGVAGFLTGGGNNFYSSMVGLGCDNVINFEVVLASVEIVNANKETNSDLHKALKGGSCNFGVVTRIDMQAIETGNLWGGQVVYPLDTTEQHIAAYINDLLGVCAGSCGIIVSSALHDTSATVRAPAYDKFLSITPQLSDTLRIDSHLNMTVELEEPSGYRQIWITLTGKNDARFIRRAVEAQSSFIADWQANQDADFLNYITFQAMPTLLFKHSVDKGGNVIGMDRETENAILFQMQHMVRTVEQETEARERLTAMRQSLKLYNLEVGVNVEWEYLGYADGSQDPLSTYGSENVQFIREVATKYDSEGIFQTRVPGGFKISRVV
ncbi:6-hydroxy-D-nicotine oxidase [Truncatella angustata]|uniref:6-hydroxy-D-nicotine oxidase n=1 Tax=Truncatella angustata TaxID=152316 RepID=A0A9P8ZV54_9PEZI|nr:6-hydroxy-D-nicotine oxidase [Truncatella angustata]KAH6652289.1 6-hydroxy-D-nicotine oxidase [Truncatella angustata]